MNMLKNLLTSNVILQISQQKTQVYQTKTYKYLMQEIQFSQSLDMWKLYSYF